MFSNMKINTKLTMLLVILLIGFALIGLTYYQVLRAETEARASEEELREFKRLVDTAHIELLQARRLERNFLLNKRLDDLERFETSINNSHEDINRLSELAISEQERELLTKLESNINNYHSNVYETAEAQITVGLDANSGLQGDVREAAHNLESRLREFNEPAIDRSMLSMRRHEKDFLLLEDAKFGARMAKEQEVFTGLLANSPLPATAKSELKELLTNYSQSFMALVEAVELRKSAEEAAEASGVAVEPLFTKVIESTDALLTTRRDAQAQEIAVITSLFMGILVLVGVIAALALFAVGRSIFNPMRHLQNTVQRVAEGNLEARSRLQRDDEIGELSNAFDNLLDERVATLAEAERENENLNNSIIGLLHAVAQLSQKDLTVKVPIAEDVTGPVGDALNLLTNETAKVLQGVTATSDDVARASTHVKAQSDSVMALAHAEREQVTHASSELASAAEAMKEIATLAQAANDSADQTLSNTQVALEAVANTVHGINSTRDTIRETEKRIKRLGERSQEISGAVNLINNIAERTHILALNASMHAASAGEAGRGFAVVADEVQRLAENARTATSEISNLVSNIQAETADTVNTMNAAISQVVEGSQLAEQAGDRMKETSDTTASLVSAVQRIAASSQSQAKISEELRNRARQIEESTEQTSAQLQAQAVQTDNLLAYASNLVESVSVFKLPSIETVLEQEIPEPVPSSASTSENEEDLKEPVLQQVV